MWKRLLNLFYPPDQSSSNAPRHTNRSADLSEPVSVESSANTLNSDEISSGYISLILGVHSLADSALNDLESDVNSRLGKVIKSRSSRENLVPRLPAIIPKLMGSLRDDNASGADLAQLIKKDASLVADVIRIANSPYYRTVNKIKSLEQAILILGRTGIRQLIANAAFKPLMNMREGHFTSLASAWIWRQSEYCAFGAQCLAKNQAIGSFEAYLAGLVRDTGTIAALKIMDHIENVGDAPRSYKFQQLFSEQCLELSALIAQEWELPDAVIIAIEDQSQKTDTGKMSVLGSVLHAAALMSKLQIQIEENRVENDHTRFNCRIDGRLTDSCRMCFSELQRYAEQTT